MSSTPLQQNIQRATASQDAMRQCIADQAATAIAENPALLGEIYRIRTPQQIEMLCNWVNSISIC